MAHQAYIDVTNLSPKLSLCFLDFSTSLRNNYLFQWLSILFDPIPAKVHGLSAVCLWTIANFDWHYLRLGWSYILLVCAQLVNMLARTALASARLTLDA